MKILIVTQNFPPDIGGGAIRLSGYANYLTQFGHKVTVLCANPVYPRGKIFEGYKNKWFQKEEKDGYTIVRTWIWPVKPKSHPIKRIISYCSFVVSACFGSFRLPKPDIIISATPSLFSSFVSIFYKKVKKVKIILDITDLWPDLALATGFMKKGTLFSLAKIVEHWIYKNVNYFTPNCEGVKKGLLKNGVKEENLTVISDCTDLEMFPLDINNEYIKQRYNLENKFVVGYAGLLGFAQKIEDIILAAKELKNYQDIVFLIVGGGGLKAKAENMVKEFELNNVIFAGEQPRREIPFFITSFSVGLITLAANDLYRNSMPSKLYDCFAANVPAIVNLKGVMWDVVKNAQAGLLAAENDPKDMANKILYLYYNPSEAKIMGNNGRAYAEEHYDRKKIVKKLEAVINKIK